MSHTVIFPGGRRLTVFEDGYRIQIGPPLADGSFVAVAFRYHAQACEGATRAAALAKARAVVDGWRAGL